MPFADYKNHADCVRKNRDKSDPHAFCAWLERKVEGSDPFVARYLEKPDWLYALWRLELMHAELSALNLMTREKAEAVIEKGPKVWRKDPDAIVLDDHRWLHMWAKTITRGDSLFISKSELRRLHDMIVDELGRRGLDSGLHHKTPLELALNLISGPLHRVLESRQPFLVADKYICYVGSSVSDKGDPRDLDVLFHGMKRPEGAENYLETMPDDLGTKQSIIWSRIGPVGPYVPGYQLWAIPTKEAGLMEPKYEIQPFSPFRPPASTTSLEKINSLLEDSYFVEPARGIRLTLHRKEDQVLAFDEDLDEFELPREIKAEALAVQDPRSFILDGFLTKSDGISTFHIADLPWWRDTELVKLSAETRRTFILKFPESAHLKRSSFRYFGNRMDTIEFLKGEERNYHVIPGSSAYATREDQNWLFFDAGIVKLAAPSDAQIKSLVDSGKWDSMKAGERFNLMTKRQSVEPLYPFAQLKTTKKGYSEREVFGQKSVPELAKDLFKVPNKQAVEVKFDAFRAQLHKKGDQIRIYTEGGTEVSERIPGISDSLKRIPAKDAVFDSEITPYDEELHALGRPGAAPALAAPAFAKGAKAAVDDSLWAAHVFDLLYIDGKDVHDLPFEERRNLLKGIELPIRDIPKDKKDFRNHLWENNVHWATSAEQMVKSSDEVSSVPGSEGAMFKQADSKYRLGGRTPLWAKMKRTFEIDCMVVGILTPPRLPKGVFNYICAIGPVSGVKDAESAPLESVKGKKFVKWKGKTYSVLGKSFNTKIVAKIGDILRVKVANVRRIDDKIYHWFHPSVLEKREDKTTPDPLQTAETIEKTGAERMARAGSWEVVGDHLKVTGGCLSEAYFVLGRYGFESPLSDSLAPWVAVPGAEDWIYLENNEKLCSVLHDLGVQLLIGTKIDRAGLERLFDSNISFTSAHAETILDVRNRPMLLEEPYLPDAVGLNVPELADFYESIRSHPIPHMKLGCCATVPLEKKLFSSDPYLTYPDESKTWKFALQFHIRGLSVHGDFRAEISKTQLVGWTWNLGKSLIKPMLRRVSDKLLSEVGLTRGQLKTMAIKEVSAKLSSTAEGKKLREKLSEKTQELPQEQLKSMCWELWREEAEPILADPKRKILTERKAPEPHEWLYYEGEVPAGAVGATSELEGVFVIMDKGTIEYGAQKSSYHEYFLYGKHLKGRFFTRRLATRAKWKMKEAFAWMTFRGKPGEKPYTISKRAVDKEWMPPQGISALPRSIRSQVPDELQYWKKKNALATRDTLVEAIKKKDVTLKLAKGLRFAVKRVWHKGAEVVRGRPVVRYWFLIHDGRRVLDAWNFGQGHDPLEESGLTARRVSGKGMEALLKKTGDIPAGHPASLTKKLVNHFDTSDEGSIQIIADSTSFVRARLKGGVLKGLYVFMKEDPHSEMWIFQKSELPKPKKAMLLSGLTDGRVLHLAPPGLETQIIGNLLIASGPAIKPGEVVPMDGKPTYFTKQGIEAIWKTMYRQPIVVLHGELKGDVIGFIDKLHYDPKTGWGWIDRGVVWHPLGIKLIMDKKLNAWSIEVIPETIWDAEHKHEHVIGGRGIGVAVVPVGACRTCTIESCEIGSVKAVPGQVYKFGMVLEEYLGHLYYNNLLSTQRIADLEGLPRSNVERYMKLAGYPRRSLVEARQRRSLNEAQALKFGGNVSITALGTGAFTKIPRDDCPQCEEARAGGKSRRNYTATLFNVGADRLLVNAPKGIVGMLGAKEVKPRWVLLEHIHEDVVGGLHELRAMNPVVFATKGVWGHLRKHYRALSGQKASFEELYNFKRYVLEPGKATQIGPFTVDPVEVKHAKPDDPSALGFRIGIGGKTVWHCSDVHRFPEDALKEIDVFIGDGASLKREIAQERDDFGHTSMEKQIQAAAEAGISRIYFTQIGHVEKTHAELNEALEEMAPNAQALHDGAEIKFLGGNPGAGLPPGLAEKLLSGDADIIIRVKPYSEYAKQVIYFTDGDMAYGLYVEGFPEGPYPAKKAESLKHGLSKKDLKKLVGDSKQIWIYRPRIIKRYSPGRPVVRNSPVGPYFHDIRVDRG